MTQAITIPDDKDLPPVPIQRQKNIPIETLLKLHNKNLSNEQVAKIVGCNPSNVTARFKRAGIKSLTDYKNHEGDILTLKSRMILSNITDAKAKKASLSQLGVVYGIMKEKELLVRGMATTIVRYDAASLRERYAELRSMLQETSTIVDKVQIAHEEDA